MKETPLFLYLIIIFDGLFFLFLAYYYLKRPPKKINEVYGYRTRKSKANQDIWDVANRRNAQDLIKYSWVVLATGILIWVFQIPFGLIIHLVIVLVGLAIAMYSTMSYLNVHFDTNGNRKE